MASDPEIHAGTKPHFWKLVTAKSENFRVSSGDASNSPHALRNKWRNAISFSRTGSYHKFAGSGVFRMVQMATRIGHFGKHHEEEEAPSPQISAEEAERKAQIRTTTQNLQHVMKRVAEHSRADLHAAVQAEDEVFEAFPASGSPGQSPPLSPLVRRSGSQGAIEQELRELDSELKEVGGASRFSSLSAPMSGESSPVNTSRQRGGSATDSLLPDPEVSPGPQWQDSPRGTRHGGGEGGVRAGAARGPPRPRLSSFFSRKGSARGGEESGGGEEEGGEGGPKSRPSAPRPGPDFPSIKNKRGSWSNLGGLRRSSSKPQAHPPPDEDSFSRGGSNSTLGMNFIVKNQQKIKRLRRKAQEVLSKIPPWATSELLASTKQRLKAFNTTETRLSALRGQNAVNQTEQETWNILFESMALGGPHDQQVVEMKLFEALDRRKAHYVEQHSKEAGDKAAIEEASMLVPGPVGDIALHQCFLLGQFDVGMKVVEEFYNRDELLNTPYGSDLKVWLDTDILSPADDDGGLYTGQTILHIAVVNASVELNRWLLLQRGANIVARATGAFFKPKRRVVVNSWIGSRRGSIIRAPPPPPQGSPSASFTPSPGSVPDIATPRGWAGAVCWRGLAVEVPERLSSSLSLLAHFLLAWIQGRETSTAADSLVKYQDNPFSACYYGEFPLSFAASLGRIEICDVLLEAFSKRRKNQDHHLKDFYEASARRQTREGKEMEKTLAAWKAQGDSGQPHPAYWRHMELDYIVNAQDSEGNTAMHMAVMHDKKETLGWLLEHGGFRSMEIVNAEGFTPLTMAVRLGRTKLFHFLLQHTREQIWQFGPVLMTKTSLVQIDTYRIGEHPLHLLPRWRSCLEIITLYEVVDFARDETFLKFIMDKWDKFARRIYIWQYILPYLFFLGITSTVLYLRCYVKKQELSDLQKGRADAASMLEWDLVTWMQNNWDWGGRGGRPRFTASVLQIFSFLVAIPTLVRNGWQSRRLRRLDLDPHESGGPYHTRQIMQFVYKNIQFLLSIGVTVAGSIATVAGIMHKPPYAKLELQALAIQSMLLWSGLLVMVMPFKFFGVLVITTWTMLTDDVFKFLVTYLTLVAAFSQALFALTQMADSEDRVLKLDAQWGNSFMKLIWVSLSDTRNIIEVLSEVSQPGLTLAIYIVYLCLVSVLMTNLLIAMMNKTFKEYMASSHIAWIFPFAHLVLRLERSMSKSMRDLHRSGAKAQAPAGVNPLLFPRPSSSHPRRTLDDELDIYYDIHVVESETTNKAIRKQHQLSKEAFLLDAVREGMLTPFKEFCVHLTDLSKAIRRETGQQAPRRGKAEARERHARERDTQEEEIMRTASLTQGDETFGNTDEVWAGPMQKLQELNGVAWAPRVGLAVLSSDQLSRAVALDSTLNLSQLSLPPRCDTLPASLATTATALDGLVPGAPPSSLQNTGNLDLQWQRSGSLDSADRATETTTGSTLPGMAEGDGEEGEGKGGGGEEGEGS